MEPILECSIGIMAYNEGQNIARLLSALQNQKLNEIEIKEIIVVASGCTDNTEEIVKKSAEKDKRIKLIAQKMRKGKASAINLWLKSTNEKILVMESADTIPAENALERLVFPFKEKRVGMAGARPVPINDSRTFWGFAAHLLWDLHHEISLENPKMGETIAFRNILASIPDDSSVDEAEIESEISRKNLRIIYVPNAIVRNKGPENLSDFLKQRRRIYTGHLMLKKKRSYKVSTASGTKIFLILIRNISLDARSIFFTPLVIMAEILGRFLGWYDFIFKRKRSAVWEIAESTKNIK